MGVPFIPMFVRKKRNKSGSVSIQIIDKANGYRVVQTVGCSKDKDEIERMFLEAKQIIRAGSKEQQWLFSVKSKDELAVESFVRNLNNTQIHTVGPELIFGALFDRIGFNAIDDELFRHLTIARLAYPVSKLKTVDYLRRYKGIDMSVYAVYRFLDRLSNQHKKEVEAIAYQYTKNRLNDIAVVFYDMTTLYFEAEDEDDLRKIGFSKDGKFQKPQILLGLLVGTEGLPIGYDIFEGNKFEGHTLIPTLNKIQSTYKFKKPIVVADAALLSRQNISDLKQEGYKFIIGARIKNETEAVKAEILKKVEGIKDGGNFVIKKEDGDRLVVTFSKKRAKKDAKNREKGIRKLKKRVRRGRLTKQSINNRGYNKFLTIHGEATVTIDENKINEDEKWDGLKGYVTNSRLSAKKITENYVHLWQIEKAFRISKTDLKIRPVYHSKKRRIEAHICIAFVAYTIYKEMERLLKKHGVKMSPKRAAELTHNMYEMEYSLPSSNIRKRQLLNMDDEQQQIYDVVYK